MISLFRKKNMTWTMLAVMSFTSLWSFGNIVNGFANYDGTHVIFQWVLVFVLYFIPYSLMVGELGSTFINEEGGTSSWVRRTTNMNLAYMAGWISFIVNMPYLSQKPTNILIAFSWAINGENRIANLSPMVVQLMALLIFLLAAFLATKGFSIIKKIASIAGMASFVMMILYILMMVAAPSIGKNVKMVDMSVESFKPLYSINSILNLSILILAVGGCEKLAPYIRDMKKPGKEFPLAMFLLVGMTVGTAILGTIALGMMFDSNNLPSDIMMNGQYQAFEILGSYYGVGNFFLVIFSIVNILCNVAVLIISIDSPLRILFGCINDDYAPKFLFVKNKHGVYINALRIVTIIVSILIILPGLGIGNINSLVKWLVKVNSVCMPLKYIVVFLAYVALKINKKKIKHGEFVFIKNKFLGIFVGMWCCILTLGACIVGMYSKDTFEFIMNVVTPIVLIGLGFIMPLTVRKRKKILGII